MLSLAYVVVIVLWFACPVMHIVHNWGPTPYRVEFLPPFLVMSHVLALFQATAGRTWPAFCVLVGAGVGSRMYLAHLDDVKRRAELHMERI